MDVIRRSRRPALPKEGGPKKDGPRSLKPRGALKREGQMSAPSTASLFARARAWDPTLPSVGPRSSSYLT
ncbi:hypothetical protein JCM18899A_16940 [Nocardioides sp. AN3]